MNKLAVVIINYKTVEMTKACVHSVLLDPIPDLQVVVVDNDSGDGSGEALCNWVKDEALSQVNVVLSERNLGFSGGNNLGIRQVEADNYLLLNSDTLVRPGALQTLINATVNFPDAGLITPRLEWEDGTPQESCFRFHRPPCEMIHSARTGAITKLLSSFEVPLRVSESVSFPEWSSFACILIRKSVLDQVGPMDEGFFLYFEDVDYCLRARQAGWKVMHTPAARVVHFRGGSSSVKRRVSERMRLPAYYYASRNRYYRKHYGLSGPIRANLYWCLGRVVSFLREKLGNTEPHICRKQGTDIWRNLFSIKRPKDGST
jgi:GT2 family glycosyltransferase